MASISDIRRHIGVVSQTRQITNAMHMISTSKMRKSMQRFAANSRYFQIIRQTMKDIITHNEDVTHPYLLRPHGERRVYIVIASDKGLAGSFNHDVLQLATEHMQDHEFESNLFTVGQQARSWFERSGKMVDIDFTSVMEEPSLDGARMIAETVLELYEQDLLDQVFIVFTSMESALVNKPRVLRLLPVLEEDFADVEIPPRESYEIRYEPSPHAVLELLVPQYMIGMVYGSILLSFAAEQSARMNAMDAATRNADEMIGKLAIDMNRARQAAITNEIAEIISGSGTLGG
jgi:F-type H+-transporting ATPase subunit gamma